MSCKGIQLYYCSTAGSLRPKKRRTSGWVKQAAGTLRWLSTCWRPQMFSTALMPCALAACASMYLPARAPDTADRFLLLPKAVGIRAASALRTSISCLQEPRNVKIR